MKNTATLGFALLCLLHSVAPVAAQDRVEDIQVLLPDGQLSRLIPAEQPVTLRISGTWSHRCTPSVRSINRNGPGRLLQLVHSVHPSAFICIPVPTAFTQDVLGVRFDEDEIGVLSVAVALTDFEAIDTRALSQGLQWLPTLDIAVQPPPEKLVPAWPTAREPPPGLYAATALYDISGGWYSPEHSGSGLILNHEPRRARGVAASVDTLWGSWANFATDGRPQWHLLSETYWASPTRLLGKVYRAEAEAVDCTAQFPNTACGFGARAARSLQVVGIFELDVTAPDALTLTIDDSGTTLLQGLVQPPVEGYRVQLRRL